MPVLAGLKSVEPLTNPIVIADVHLTANKPKTIMANLRYKGKHLYSSSMGLEEYQKAYADWKAQLAG